MMPMKELRHPLQPSMSQEQIAILVIIDCLGGLPHATNIMQHYREIKLPEKTDRQLGLIT